MRQKTRKDFFKKNPQKSLNVAPAILFVWTNQTQDYLDFKHYFSSYYKECYASFLFQYIRSSISSKQAVKAKARGGEEDSRGGKI